jgi:general secretion pathway protein D
LLLLLAAGCATTQQAASKGEEAIEHRNWDAAVYYYLEALAREPDNLQYRMALIRARQKASEEHFSRGVVLRDLGRLMPARREMEMAVQLDPSNQYAEQELAKLIHDLEILSRPDGEATLEELKRQAREAKVKPPLLDPRVDEKVSLNFPTARPVKEIYKAISKAYGFNVTFDSKLKDDKLAIELNDVTAERAIELVMQQANHFYKVLDEHSIIIAEDTPQNRREYEDLVIKTFFLSNAEVKDVDKLLRSLIEARRLATNEQLNAITLRDTADKVAIAEKLIAINDKAKAEVLIDVELLQVNSSRERDLGANLSSLQFGLQLDLDRVATPVDGTVTLPADGSLYLNDLGNINKEAMFINIPSVVINLVKSSGESETLAQPQLRITEGEKASLVIGDQVPIPVTAFNSGNTGGGGVVPITSFQYKDVGIKIDVEPRVHHNHEITLKLTVEVSQLGDPVSVGPGQSAVTIGTRTINSVIRLKNGESSLLAGLLRVDRTESNSKTPLLSDIPVIGRLFTNVKTSHRTTDLILTLTPHVIRFPDIQEEDLAPVWVGTESRITYFGSRPRVEAGRSPTGPFDERTDAAGRTRSTPRVRSPGTAGERTTPRRTPTSQQPKGRNLVPSSTQEESAPLYEDEGYDSMYETPGESMSPVLVRLEPAIATIASGQQLELRVVSVGGSGSFRMPLGLSFDSKRITVLDVDPSPGVLVAEQQLDLENGWFTLDLIVGEGDDLPQVLATILIQGENPGPVPLLLSSEGAVNSDGSYRQVAVEDGTLLVQEQEVIFNVGGRQ